MFHFYSTTNPSFEVSSHIYEEGKELQLTLPVSGVLFVLDGEICIRFAQFENPDVSTGQILFLPPEGIFYLKVKKDSRVITLQIPDMETFCYHFLPPGVFKKKVVCEKSLYALQMNKFLNMTAVDIETYIQAELIHPMLVKIKSLELFHFLTTTYGDEDLACFFAPILSRDYIFSQFVLENYDSVKTVEELAKLSNYSLSGFEKQFRKVFGTAPYKWMVKKKTEKIYYEIFETTKPLKVIAEESGFAGLSQLSDFCRKRLGASPATIRSKRQS